MNKTPAAPVTLLYDGWQVWDGEFGVVRVGSEVVASIEFVQRSRPSRVDSAPQIEHLGKNRYLVTANVLDVSDAVVLDLGALRALRRIRPDEAPGDFEAGQTVSLVVTLNLNGWPDASWSKRADEVFGTDHRWRVHRITRMTTGSDEAKEIEEAATETVDSARHYCLLECTLVD